jgi:hypothetical protein
VFNPVINSPAIAVNAAARHGPACRLVFTPIDAVTSASAVAPVLLISNQGSVSSQFADAWPVQLAFLAEKMALKPGGSTSPSASAKAANHSARADGSDAWRIGIAIAESVAFIRDCGWDAQ